MPEAGERARGAAAVETPNADPVAASATAVVTMAMRRVTPIRIAALPTARITRTRDRPANSAPRQALADADLVGELEGDRALGTLRRHGDRTVEGLRSDEFDCGARQQAEPT